MKTFSVFILVLLIFSCGNLKKNAEASYLNYTISEMNIERYKLDGNIIIEVYDSQSNPLKGYLPILRKGQDIVFDFPIKEYTCTFFEDGNDLTIEIIKEGYHSVLTKSFSTVDNLDNAKIIKVILLPK